MNTQLTSSTPGRHYLTYNCTAAIADIHCMPDNDRCVQQHYKLLTDVNAQVRCVSCGKNFIDKIRFSHHFRRWQDHHISLEQSEIVFTTVVFFHIYIQLMKTFSIE